MKTKNYKKYRVWTFCEVHNRVRKKIVSKKEFFRLLTINEVICYEGI